VVEARDAVGGYRNLIAPTLRAETASGAAATVTARQVAPGRYAATLTAGARQPVTVTLLEGDGLPSTSVVVPFDPAAEYRFRPADEALLESLASMTGGSMRPDAAALSRGIGAQPATRHALWPLFVSLALALWFVDIALRRIRLFEATMP
jgi:hypothetical protein